MKDALRSCYTPEPICLRHSAPLLLSIFLILWSGLACRVGRETTKPIPIDTASREYAEVVQAFYIGLAALQGGEQVRAEERLTQATQLMPEEPAAWANLGLLALRQRKVAFALVGLAPTNKGESRRAAGVSGRRWCRGAG